MSENFVKPFDFDVKNPLILKKFVNLTKALKMALVFLPREKSQCQIGIFTEKFVKLTRFLKMALVFFPRRVALIFGN